MAVTHGKTRARVMLDNVRALLQLPAVTDRVCLTCGGELFGDDPCELCGGRQVAAENVIRALREALLSRASAPRS